MSAMQPGELLRQWAGEDLPTETAIGHVLQNLVKLQASVDALKETVALLRAETIASSVSIEKTGSARQKYQTSKH